MNERIVVGLQPWLPWPLSRWTWWTEPVPAERLAALRIGLAAVLLIDVLTAYLPHGHDFFGQDSLGAPGQFRAMGPAPRWRWSLLSGVENPVIIQLAMAGWALAALLLLVGMWTRLSAVAAWLLSTSFATLNPYIDNAGDEVRGIILFYLIWCPGGAVWSVDAWRQRQGDRPAVFVPPWPLRLLFLQLVLIYFSNGLYKLTGSDWRSGTSLYDVLSDPTLTRWSYAEVPVPYELTRLLTWLILAWEIGFPLLVLWRKTRIAALEFGVAFHLGIGLTLELGWFAPYMLCLYLPLVPWERWRSSRREKIDPPPVK